MRSHGDTRAGKDEVLGEVAMTLEFRILIGGETHDIRVDVPAGKEGITEDLRSFAIATAWLEHFGYLPRNVVNARD